VRKRRGKRRENVSTAGRAAEVVGVKTSVLETEKGSPTRLQLAALHRLFARSGARTAMMHDGCY